MVVRVVSGPGVRRRLFPAVRITHRSKGFVPFPSIAGRHPVNNDNVASLGMVQMIFVSHGIRAFRVYGGLGARLWADHSGGVRP